jgi:hypothetical protein
MCSSASARGALPLVLIAHHAHHRLRASLYIDGANKRQRARQGALNPECTCVNHSPNHGRHGIRVERGRTHTHVTDPHDSGFATCALALPCLVLQSLPPKSTLRPPLLSCWR